MGNSTIGIIVGLCSVAGSIVAPTVYMGNIKENVATQNVRLTAVEASEVTSRQDISDLNKKIDALLWKQGINPQSIISKN